MPTYYNYDQLANTITIDSSACSDSSGGWDTYKVVSTKSFKTDVDPSDFCKQCKTRHCNGCPWDPTIDAPKKKVEEKKFVPWADKLNYINTNNNRNNSKWKYMKNMFGEWILQLANRD